MHDHSFVTEESMRRFVSLVLFVVVACASGGGGSSTRPKGMERPDIDVNLANPLFFGSGTTAPATIDVTVRNRGSEPFIIRRVELSSPGMMQYGLIPTTREFRQSVAAGETKAVTVFATAQTAVRRPSEPLTIRAIIEFEAANKERWREIVMAQQRF